MPSPSACRLRSFCLLRAYYAYQQFEHDASAIALLPAYQWREEAKRQALLSG